MTTDLCYVCLSEEGEAEEEPLLHGTCACKDRSIHLSCQKDMIRSSLRADPFSCPVCESPFSNLLVARQVGLLLDTRIVERRRLSPQPPPLLRFALHHTAFLVCYRASSSQLVLLAIWGLSSAIALHVLAMRTRGVADDPYRSTEDTNLLVCFGMTIAHMLMAVVTSVCNVPILLLLQLCLLVLSGATVLT